MKNVGLNGKEVDPICVVIIGFFEQVYTIPYLYLIIQRQFQLIKLSKLTDEYKNQQGIHCQQYPSQIIIICMSFNVFSEFAFR